MKFLVVLAITCAVAVSSSPTHSEQETSEQLKAAWDSILNKTINAVVKALPDPITLPDLKIPIPEVAGLDGGIEITDFAVTGLKKLVATTIDISITHLSLNMELDIPKLSISVNNDIELDYNNSQIIKSNGTNTIDIVGSKLVVAGNVDVDLLHLSIEVNNVTALVTVDDILFHLDGLFNQPEIRYVVNSLLDDIVAPLINANNHLLSNIIGTIIEDAINAAIPLAAIYKDEIEQSGIRRHIAN